MSDVKHGEEINFWQDEDDPEMWFGLAMPMDVYLARGCRCEARCECEALNGGSAT